MVGSVPANRIARWDGSRWRALGTGADGTVRAVCERNGSLYAGGDFLSVGGTSSPHLARWSGLAWTDVSGGTSATVTALASALDGLYVGGFFQQAGGRDSEFIARWNDDTASASSGFGRPSLRF